jgi:glycerate kinase
MVKNHPPTILVAPNSMKGSLSAFDAVNAIKEGLHASWPNITCREAPLADGGELTMDILLNARGGKKRTVDVVDPLGRPITSCFGALANGQTAVVELAKASGYSLLKEEEKDPLATTTYGTGQLISSALDEGYQRIITGLGGSATVDAGAGMLQALGYRLLDQQGNDIGWGGGALRHLSTIDPSQAHPRLQQCNLLTACDVQNPLLGEEGAARVFAPQKGAKPEDVSSLEEGHRNFVNVIRHQLGVDIGTIPHGGAAGGIAATIGGILQGQLLNGTDFLLDESHIEQLIDNSDLVITAEGSLDQQTLQGKAPYGLAKRAKEHTIPVMMIAGQVPIELSATINVTFDAFFPINHSPCNIDEAIANSYANVKRTAFSMGNLLKVGFNRIVE